MRKRPAVLAVSALSAVAVALLPRALDALTHRILDASFEPTSRPHSPIG